MIGIREPREPEQHTELLAPEHIEVLSEDLEHWEPLSAENAFRVMSSPLMANDPPFFRRVLELEREVASLRKQVATCSVSMRRLPDADA